MLKTDSKKLETRDFISVGIFSLIYAVVAFVIGGAAQMTPVTFPFMPMIVALFTGTVFTLYVAKIPKKGALSILGVIAAILLFVTGMFWMMSVFFLVFGLTADFICASADFRSFKKNLLAYCDMALAPMGASIRDAMALRGISASAAGLISHPIQTMEHVYVPLLVSASRISDEITQAAITRGIEHTGERSCIEEIAFSFADLLVVIAYAAVVAGMVYAGMKGVF